MNGAPELISGWSGVLSDGGADVESFQPWRTVILGSSAATGWWHGSGPGGMDGLSRTRRAGRAVAVKVIRPELAENAEFRKRFQAEVAAAKPVHGLTRLRSSTATPGGRSRGCATAYVPGPSLADAVRHHGPLPSTPCCD